MVVFTIDATQVIFTTHRLKVNGEFGKKQDIFLEDDDKLFRTYHDAENWMERNKEVVIDGDQIKNDGSATFGSTYLTVRQHRDSKPQNEYFSIQEVDKLLRNGDDNRHNSLVVDYDGNVHLVEQSNAMGGYAVRFETFEAGNGYVGSKSSLNHIDGTYQALLEGWVEHLANPIGDDVYRDYSTGKRTIEELIQDAKDIIAAMQY